MSLKKFTRLSDGVEITVNDKYLTKSISNRLGDPKKPEIPEAIKTKRKRNESN